MDNKEIKEEKLEEISGGEITDHYNPDEGCPKCQAKCGFETYTAPNGKLAVLCKNCGRTVYAY